MPAHKWRITMNYLGIDVSKKKIDCCLIVGDKYLHRVLKNDQSGFEKLRDWLKKYTAEPVYACLEATGIYSEHIADWLHDETRPAYLFFGLLRPATLHGFHWAGYYKTT